MDNLFESHDTETLLKMSDAVWTQINKTCSLEFARNIERMVEIERELTRREDQ